jgi:hypothetical protein
MIIFYRYAGSPLNKVGGAYGVQFLGRILTGSEYHLTARLTKPTLLSRDEFLSTATAVFWNSVLPCRYDK